MRILFPYLARWRSANRSRYHHLLFALAERGHDVTVLQAPAWNGGAETNYADTEGPEHDLVRIQEAEVSRTAWNLPMPLPKLFRKGMVTLFSRPAVRRIIREEKIDAVLLYNLPQFAVAPARGPAVVFDVADDLLAMLAQETGPLRLAAIPAARTMLRKVIRRADAVTACSETAARAMGVDAVIVPNGVDPRHFPAEGSRRSGRPVVGYLGAFEYFIDLDLVLDLARRMPEYDFVLAGGGRELSRSRRNGAPNVAFPGPLAFEDAARTMSTFDVALIPFRSGPVADSASPLKLFEYAAAGAPIVSTPTEEIRATAGDSIRYALTPDEWASAVKETLRDPEAAALRLKPLRERIRTDHDWGVLAGRMEEVMERAIDSRR